jgi:hypothetical protein
VRKRRRAVMRVDRLETLAVKAELRGDFARAARILERVANVIASHGGRTI